jgi:hypothetical protein
VRALTATIDGEDPWARWVSLCLLAHPLPAAPPSSAAPPCLSKLAIGVPMIVNHGPLIVNHQPVSGGLSAPCTLLTAVPCGVIGLFTMFARFAHAHSAPAHSRPALELRLRRRGDAAEEEEQAAPLWMCTSAPQLRDGWVADMQQSTQHCSGAAAGLGASGGAAAAAAAAAEAVAVQAAAAAAAAGEELRLAEAAQRQAESGLLQAQEAKERSELQLPAPEPEPEEAEPEDGEPTTAAAVSRFCACIGSPCLRHCVRGASIGGGGGGEALRAGAGGSEARRGGGARSGVGAVSGRFTFYAGVLTGIAYMLRVLA